MVASNNIYSELGYVITEHHRQTNRYYVDLQDLPLTWYAVRHFFIMCLSVKLGVLPHELLAFTTL